MRWWYFVDCGGRAGYSAGLSLLWTHCHRGWPSWTWGSVQQPMSLIQSGIWSNDFIIIIIIRESRNGCTPGTKRYKLRRSLQSRGCLFSSITMITMVLTKVITAMIKVMATMNLMMMAMTTVMTTMNMIMTAKTRGLTAMTMTKSSGLPGWPFA